MASSCRPRRCRWRRRLGRRPGRAIARRWPAPGPGSRAEAATSFLRRGGSGKAGDLVLAEGGIEGGHVGGDELPELAAVVGEPLNQQGVDFKLLARGRIVGAGHVLEEVIDGVPERRRLPVFVLALAGNLVLVELGFEGDQLGV